MDTLVTPSAVARDRFVGHDEHVPLLDGRKVPYLNLDNAASTPALNTVTEALEKFLPYYSSVHRGSGFKSRLSSEAYDRAHQLIGTFVSANMNHNTVIFGKNTTEAVNKLAYRFPFKENAVVLTTLLEHHSNDLPWRNRAQVVHVKATPEGRLDEEDFDKQLAAYEGRVALVAVSGASNVTGFIQPIHRLARKAHAAGAKIFIDAAQLAPHRPVDMKADDDPEHLDFVALSAHKLYAPFGTGALVGAKEIFLQGPPEYQGGGTVDIVTPSKVYWAGLPDREEAGSPNVVGVVAMAAALRTLSELGMEVIAARECELTAYALEQLTTVPGINIYGEKNPAKMRDKVGVIPFNLEGIPHALVAAILGYEAGIGVRSGCFCAHPYVVHLLGLSQSSQQTWHEQVLEGSKAHLPGMVRISFGAYNEAADVDRLVAGLKRIVKKDYGNYRLEPTTGDYLPVEHVDTFDDYFTV